MTKRLGMAIHASTVRGIVEGVKKAEDAGISVAWLSCGQATPDAITIAGAAFAETERIMIGTAVVPTYPRHPVAIVQQVQVIAQLAPDRFRLGVGPSGKGTMENVFGIEYRAPLSHLSEYLQIATSLLGTGEVDFDGRYYKAHAKIGGPVNVPVMASSLGAKSFELCGRLADGVITWSCSAPYLRDVGLPAIKAGADRAGRSAPPLIAHVPVCLSTNPEDVREAVRQQMAFYPTVPHYQRMFVASGFPEALNGTWSDAMVDGIALWGDESRIADGLNEVLALGATEILASPVLVGDDRAAALERTTKLLGRLAPAIEKG